LIDVEELRAVTSGAVLAPDSDGWTDALRGHNTAVRHEPVLVVQAAAPEDVSASVAFAARHGLSVGVQATGHGPPQLHRGGLLIRTDGLTGIDLDSDARIVRVGAGVTWGELMAAGAAAGLAPLGMASVASVGVVGYTLGGGMGPLARAQGFAADHVRAVELVDPQGRVRRIDAESEPDLFWAVRGGRTGFGVVTAMTLELAAAPSVFAATLTYPRADAATALTAYASWQAGLPDDATTVATLFRFPDLPELPGELRGQRMLRVDLVAVGAAGQARAAVDRLVAAAAPATRADATVDPAGWLRAQPPVPVGPSWQRGVVIDRLDDDALARLLAAAGLETEAPWGVLELRPLGGAMGRPAAVGNAVTRWPEGVLVNTVAAGPPEALASVPAAHGQLVQQLGNHVVPGVPVNFYGLADATRPLSAAWPDANYRRLEEVRRNYDPDGRFGVDASARA
jgi:FAD/FMN-containing dehydrogenase